MFSHFRPCLPAQILNQQPLPSYPVFNNRALENMLPLQAYRHFSKHFLLSAWIIGNPFLCLNSSYTSMPGSDISSSLNLPYKSSSSPHPENFLRKPFSFLSYYCSTRYLVYLLHIINSNNLGFAHLLQ